MRFCNLQEGGIIIKTISITEFESLVTLDDWEREQEWVIDYHLVREEHDAALEDIVPVAYVAGRVHKTSVLDGITISYSVGFVFDDDGGQSKKPLPDCFVLEGLDDGDDWLVVGGSILMEDGSKAYVGDLVQRLGPEFSDIDFRALATDLLKDRATSDWVSLAYGH